MRELTQDECRRIVGGSTNPAGFDFKPRTSDLLNPFDNPLERFKCYKYDPKTGLPSGTISSFGKYEFKNGIDLDLRGKSTFQSALDLAFQKTATPKQDFHVTKWGVDELGKSHPVEWRANNSAEVSIDLGHPLSSLAPTVPHIGWQTGGKRGTGGAMRGHIFIDDVLFNR